MDLFESLMNENKKVSKRERRIKQLQESSWMIQANKSGYSFKDLAHQYESETGVNIYNEDVNIKDFLRWVKPYKESIQGKNKGLDGYKKVSRDNPNKYLCLCMDCGYEEEMTPAEYDGCCPRCHEHHGFIMFDGETDEDIEVVDDLSESFDEDDEEVLKSVNKPFKITYDQALDSKKEVRESTENFEVYNSRGNKIPDDLKSSVTHIVIEDGVESIQKAAFEDCTALESVEIPDSVVSIGPSAFEGCTALESVILPRDLEEIRAFTFAGCTSLKEITIPEKVNWIAYGAFAYSGLQDVKILSKDLDYIADDAFDGCDPMLDATEAEINFDFGEYCERNNLACEVEKERVISN